MKSYLTTALGLVCLLLVIALVVIKRSDSARHQEDLKVIAESSDQLGSTRTQLAVHQGKMLILSNRLEESVSKVSALSNDLSQAVARIDADKEQLAQLGVLNQRVADTETANRAFASRLTELTNQLATFAAKLVSTEARLVTTSNDFARNYGLLENRLRRDVAERVMAERKFNNLSELQAQVEKLKGFPADPATTESILAGLDVEVKSNGTFHVISPE